MSIKSIFRPVLSNRVAAAGMGYTIGNLLIKGIAFLSTPIFSRMLSPSQYGIVSSYLAYETYLVIIVGVMLNSSVKNARYEFKERFDTYISTIVSIVWVNTIVLVSIVILLRSILSSYTGLSVGLLVLLVFNGAGMSIVYIYNSYISLSYDYKRYLLISGFNAISNFVLSIAFMLTLFSAEQEIGRILGYGLPVVGIQIYLTLLFYRKAKPEFDKRIIGFAYKYCFPLIPFGFAEATLGQFGRLVIQKLVGNTELGIYSLSYSVYSIIGIIRISLDNVWGPWFYEKYSSGNLIVIKKRTSLYILGLSVFTLLAMLLSPEIIWIMGDTEYADAIFSVIPLVVASYFIFLSSIPIQVEYFTKKTACISVGVVSVAIINIGMTYVTVKHFGYQMTAYSTLISYVLLSIYHFFMAKRIADVQIFDLRIAVISSTFLICFIPIAIKLIDYLLLRYIIVVCIIFLSIIYIHEIAISGDE